MPKYRINRHNIRITTLLEFYKQPALKNTKSRTVGERECRASFYQIFFGFIIEGRGPGNSGVGQPPPPWSTELLKHKLHFFGPLTFPPQLFSTSHPQNLFPQKKQECRGSILSSSVAWFDPEKGPPPRPLDFLKAQVNL